MENKLNKELFWDINYKQIDFEKNKEFLVSRVLELGDLKDFTFLKKKYGFEQIKKIAKRVKYLDKKSLNFWSFYFKIPKEKFSCFTKSWKTKQDPFCRR